MTGDDRGGTTASAYLTGVMMAVGLLAPTSGADAEPAKVHRVGVVRFPTEEGTDGCAPSTHRSSTPAAAPFQTNIRRFILCR
jgi:hypothetical protein